MTLWFRMMVMSCIVGVCPLVLCGQEPRQVKPMDTTAFAAKLYAQLQAREGNLFFSPTSIETALAMTYAGAKGVTAEQMANTLCISGSGEEVSSWYAGVLKQLNNPPAVWGWVDKTGKPMPAYKLVVANALWGQQGYPFSPEFIQLVKSSYAAGLNSVDFRQSEQARNTINTWVADQTHDKIKDLIAKGFLQPDTRLVLTNAIYFKSNWATKFQETATRKEPFHRTTDQSNDVPMMHQIHNFGYTETADLQLLELPYMEEDLSMVVLLPRTVDGLKDLEKNLTAENLRQWFKEAKPELVQVTLPKFTFSDEMELARILRAMGMTDAFDPVKADFSGMSSAERLFISAVIHKAFVAVDEDGTEAAAATAVGVRATAMMRRPDEPKIFKADHPFVFLIRHRSTGEILFMGRLSDPKAG